jgi:hypothetical protein
MTSHIHVRKRKQGPDPRGGARPRVRQLRARRPADCLQDRCQRSGRSRSARRSPVCLLERTRSATLGGMAERSRDWRKSSAAAVRSRPDRAFAAHGRAAAGLWEAATTGVVLSPRHGDAVDRDPAEAIETGPPRTRLARRATVRATRSRRLPMDGSPRRPRWCATTCGPSGETVVSRMLAGGRGAAGTSAPLVSAGCSWRAWRRR